MFVSLIFSLLLVDLLNPLVVFFEKKGFSRKKPAIIIFCITALLSVSAAVFSVVPFFSKLPDLISNDLPLYRENLYKHFNIMIKHLVEQFPFLRSLDIEGHITDTAKVLPDKMAEKAKDILPEIIRVFVLTPIFTFFFLKDGMKLKKWIISLLPNRYFEMSLHLLRGVSEQWGRYIRGKTWETITLSIIISILFIPTGLQYKVLLGFFVGITSIVPYIGPFIGAIPVMIVALMLDLPPKMIIYILIVIFVIGRLIDTMVLMPFFVTRHANLHSVAVIISLIIGQQIMGIMGMIIAIPVVSMLNILIQEIYAFYKFKGRAQDVNSG